MSDTTDMRDVAITERCIRRALGYLGVEGSQPHHTSTTGESIYRAGLELRAALVGLLNMESQIDPHAATVRITELESLLAEQDAQLAPLRDPEWEFAATLKLIAGQPGIDATSKRVLTELASRLPASDGERTNG